MLVLPPLAGAGNSVSFTYSCWLLQSDLCGLWDDHEGAFWAGPWHSSTQSSHHLWSSHCHDLRTRSETSNRNCAKRNQRSIRPCENSSGLIRLCSTSCLCTLAGVKWYMGFISILVWRLHFCQLQEDSLWGAVAPLWRWTVWGTSDYWALFCLSPPQDAKLLALILSEWIGGQLLKVPLAFVGLS